MKYEPSLRISILGKCKESQSFDQIYFIEDLVTGQEKAERSNLLNKYQNSVHETINKFSDFEIVVFENLKKDLYSQIISLGLMDQVITPEYSLKLSLAEEFYQLNRWSKIADYHTAKEKEVLSRIYYNLFLLEFKN